MTSIDKEKLLEILSNTEFKYDGPGQMDRTPEQFTNDMAKMILSLFTEIIEDQPEVKK